MKAPVIPTPEDGLCWLTGASSGIGEALLADLVKEGWRVAISARSEDKLHALARCHPGKVFAYPVDITDDRAVAATVAAN
jgi:NADP-dependent 3-hydroxy acid dehydrogenase YdfG